MAPEPEKEYTMEEVSKHNKVDDCWLVIGNDATGKTQMIYLFTIPGPSEGCHSFPV